MTRRRIKPHSNSLYFKWLAFSITDKISPTRYIVQLFRCRCNRHQHRISVNTDCRWAFVEVGEPLKVPVFETSSVRKLVEPILATSAAKCTGGVGITIAEVGANQQSCNTGSRDSPCIRKSSIRSCQVLELEVFQNDTAYFLRNTLDGRHENEIE